MPEQKPIERTRCKCKRQKPQCSEPTPSGAESCSHEGYNWPKKYGPKKAAVTRSRSW